MAYCDDDGHVVNEGIAFRTGTDQFIHMGGPMVGWFSGRGEAVDGEVPAHVVDLPFVEMKPRRSAEPAQPAA